MKSFIVLALFVAAAAALPLDNSKDATIVRQEQDIDGVKGYRYASETSDGKKTQEEGVLENVGTEDEAISVRGAFQYVGDDGVTYAVSYIADKNGFQPSGAHLPVAPTA